MFHGVNTPLGNNSVVLALGGETPAVRLPVKASVLITCVQCGARVTHEVMLLAFSPSLLSPELPYGWEKIEDPQFGTYYVE